MDKILVEVYNGKTDAGACSSCAGGCGVIDAEGQFNDMKTALGAKYGDEQVEFKYIDTRDTGFGDYPQIVSVVRMGYSFPITVVNGKPRLAGAVPADAVEGIIEEIIAE